MPTIGDLTALAVLEQMRLPVTEQQIRRGLLQARLSGRMQLWQAQPRVLLDVAHNPHSAAYLASQLQQKYDGQQATQLAVAVKQMAGIHDALLVGGQRFQQTLGGPDDKLLAPPAVNAAVAHFLELGRSLAGLTPESANFQPTANELVALSLGSLLPELDHLVDLYQSESERRSDALRVLQASALLATLGLLAISALGVLRPLIGQVRGTLEDLERSDQALRQAMSENQLILETTDDGIFGVDRDSFGGSCLDVSTGLIATGRDHDDQAGHYPDSYVFHELIGSLYWIHPPAHASAADRNSPVFQGE